LIKEINARGGRAFYRQQTNKFTNKLLTNHVSNIPPKVRCYNTSSFDWTIEVSKQVERKTENVRNTTAEFIQSITT